MLGNTNTDAARDSWTNTPGHSTAMEYNENGKLTKLICIDNGTTVFVKTLTYNDAGKCILITCTEN